MQALPDLLAADGFSNRGPGDPHTAQIELVILRQAIVDARCDRGGGVCIIRGDGTTRQISQLDRATVGDQCSGIGQLKIAAVMN